MKSFIKRATRTRKRLVGSATVLMVLVSGSVAFGYYAITFTGVSSSSSTITNASSGGTVQNGGTAVELGANWGAACKSGDVALAPGVTDTLCLTATDLDTVNTSKVYTTQITGMAVTVDPTHAAAGCLASWFVLAPSTEDLASQPVNPGESDSSYGNALGTITFTNVASSQAACEGAQIGVTFTGTAS
jgi:hypothetical protein